MRELFDELFRTEPVDPIEAARRSVRPQTRKRFYREAAAGDDCSIQLDGKPVMTPKRRPLKGPNLPIAQALAAEWDAQREFIDPAAMPLTRLANSIIDGVADAPDAVRDEIAKYLHSDLVFYRADSPEGLVANQARAWDPLLDFARDQLGARFVLAEGVMHVAQAEEAVAAAVKAISKEPWRLGAVAAVTALTGSVLIALALADGHLDLAGACTATFVDEDWNMAAWGKDEAALARRAAQLAELEASATVLRLC
jgi:chaperone required for assembly of F1-ATPase